MDRTLRLITGGTGFIGSNITGNVHLSSRDFNLTRTEEVQKLFNFYKIDEIIHCAAKHGSFMEMSKGHTKYLSDNLKIDANLIQTSALNGISKLIATSSVSTLGKSSSGIYTISDLSFNNFTNSNFGYNVSKRSSIDLCKAVYMDYGYKYKSVLLGNIYGPRDHFTKSGTVVASIISQMLEAKQSGQDLKLYGNGKDRRNFTYVGDLNEIFSFLLENDSTEPIIISSNWSASIFELANLIKKVINFKEDIIFLDLGNYKETYKLTSDSQLKEIGFLYEFTNLEVGIEKTVEWVLSNAKNS
jgi:GDP-L-fucose synthase